MITAFREWRRHRRLKQRPPAQQILILLCAIIENPEVLDRMEPQAAAAALFSFVEGHFRQLIEAGIDVTGDEWRRWGRYEGGRLLQKWWIHSRTMVDDLRIAKLAKLIHDTLCGKGKAERIALEALPSEQQDVLLRRILSGVSGGRTLVD